MPSFFLPTSAQRKYSQGEGGQIKISKINWGVGGARPFLRKGVGKGIQEAFSRGTQPFSRGTQPFSRGSQPFSASLSLELIKLSKEVCCAPMVY